jgi:hypothetical protein
VRLNDRRRLQSVRGEIGDVVVDARRNRKIELRSRGGALKYSTSFAKMKDNVSE